MCKCMYTTQMQPINYNSTSPYKRSVVCTILISKQLENDQKLEYPCSMFSVGRKKALCVGLFLLLVSSVCVTFVPEFYTFGIMEFIIGGCAHGTFVCIAVLCKYGIYNNSLNSPYL